MSLFYSIYHDPGSQEFKDHNSRTNASKVISKNVLWNCLLVARHGMMAWPQKNAQEIWLTHLLCLQSHKRLMFFPLFFSGTVPMWPYFMKLGGTQYSLLAIKYTIFGMTPTKNCWHMAHDLFWCLCHQSSLDDRGHIICLIKNFFKKFGQNPREMLHIKFGGDRVNNLGLVFKGMFFEKFKMADINGNGCIQIETTQGSRGNKDHNPRTNDLKVISKNISLNLACRWHYRDGWINPKFDAWIMWTILYQCTIFQ